MDRIVPTIERKQEAKIEFGFLRWTADTVKKKLPNSILAQITNLKTVCKDEGCESQY